VLGIDQDFSNHKMRETLGWEPRIDYATGLAKTVAWLQNDYLGPISEGLCRAALNS
jgi:nucleoside-diphosphate-sugar epimerase